MTDFWKTIISTILGGVLTGLFTLLSGWLVYRREIDKMIINKKHEIALYKLIPNLYNPLMQILSECEENIKLGKYATFDVNKILTILEENTCWLLFVPPDTRNILEDIKRVCYLESLPTKIDVARQDQRLFKLLTDLRSNFQNKFKKYVL